MKFTWWEAVLLVMALYWPVTLAVTLILAGLGLYLKGTARKVLLTIAALPVLAALGVGVVFLAVEIKEANSSRVYQASYAKRHITLSQPTTVAGVLLPAGTTILWRDDAMTYLDEFDLPHPSLVLGAKLTGHVKHPYDDFYDVTLAENSLVAGWPCAAGDIELTPKGEPWNCILFRRTEVPSPTGRPLYFPAKTLLALSPGSDTGHTFEIPEGASMRLPDVAETVPAGNTVRLYPNGGERGVYASGDTLFTVRGIPFVTDVSFGYEEDLEESANGPHARPTGAFGTLGKTVICDSTLYPQDMSTFVRVNLRNNTVLFEHGTVGDDEMRATQPVPASHCRITKEPDSAETQP